MVMPADAEVLVEGRELPPAGDGGVEGPADAVVVEKGELTGNTPGRLIRRTWTIPGDTGEVLSLYEERF